MWVGYECLCMGMIGLDDGIKRGICLVEVDTWKILNSL